MNKKTLKLLVFAGLASLCMLASGCVAGGQGSPSTPSATAMALPPGTAPTQMPGGSSPVPDPGSTPADPVVPNSLMTKSLTISGGALFNYMVTRDELLRRARDVFHGLAEGWLKLHVDRTFPLAEAAQAHRLLEGRQTVGKLILKTGT